MLADPNISGKGVNGGYTEGARVYNDAAIDIVNITSTNLTFNQERYDTDNIHDTGSNTSRLTCKTAGKYLIAGHITWEPDANGARQMLFLLNDTTAIGIVQGDAAEEPDFALRQSVTTVYDLSVNDYVEMQVYHSAGHNLEVQSAGSYTPEFMMQRIG